MAEVRLQRRLAAILSADVVGYSRLMGLDEAKTLSRLNALRRVVFQKRSISNVRQFGVDGRKTLFLLLLLFAIPADDCSAQTPPPPVDEHAFERVPPTVVKKLATRFSLGAFAGRFEETPLGAVRKAVGEGTIQHQGDAGGSIYWLCYRRAQHRLWVVSHGEMGGRDHLVTEIVEEFTEKDTETSTDCAIIPEKFAP